MKKTVTAFDIEGNSFEAPVNELAFRPAIYGVILKEGKVLMSKQWDGYDFPGGGIELGESLSEALVREVKEETGLDVKMGRVLHTNSSYFKLPKNGLFVHSIHLYHVCEILGGELSTDFLEPSEQEYAQMPEWIDLEKLEKVKIYTSANVAELVEQLKQ